MFDANVRAYQGRVEVNKEISDSLKNPTPDVDFWWLNNGVTVVADSVSLGGDEISIDNPLIVNGLQTSYELYKNRESLSESDARKILVRVIVETDHRKRNEIIRATNRQTTINHSSFRATDPIHEDIERYLQGKNFFYDRRKNMHRGQGKPVDRIISIDRMAQGVLSILSQEPDTARARPGTVLKQGPKSRYEEIFPPDREKHPLEMYGVVAELMDAVEKHIRDVKKNTNDSINRGNLRFHILMVLGWALNGSQTLPAKRIGQLNISGLSSELLKVVTDWVVSEFNRFGGDDTAAKGPQFTKTLKNKWSVGKTKKSARKRKSKNVKLTNIGN